MGPLEILGPGVGKTALIKRFCEDDFLAEPPNFNAIGPELQAAKEQIIASGESIRLYVLHQD